MKPRRHDFAVILLAALLACGHAAAADPDTLVRKIDDLVGSYAADGNFAGSVLVAKAGDVLLAKGYGLADPERDIPNTADTKFMIGSITKQFTAMLVTQLVEKGVLHFDDTISDFLPRFPRGIGERITVEMLLLHTSGLRLPEGIERYYPATRNEDYLDIFIEQLTEQGLRFESGTGYGYSNAGYHILGMIIEKATGRSYEEVLAEQILRPLGMADTGCNRAGLVLEDGAVSYHRIPGRIVTWSPEHSFDPGIVFFGSGFLYSTVGDLLKFSEALSGDALLTDEYRSLYLKMRNPKTRLPLPNVPQGHAERFFGEFGNGFVGEISSYEDPDTGRKDTLYWHDGTMYLFKSCHYRFADEGLVIIVLSNSSVRMVADEIVMKIHELSAGRPCDDVRIKRSLWQYVEEDIGTHAGFEAAAAEYHRLKADTLNFVVPSPARVRRAELEHALHVRGLEAMVAMARDLRAGKPCEIDENTLNSIGYELLEDGRIDNALKVFRLNVEFYPNHANGYDSLGEAYMTAGQTELAIENYKRALALDPTNDNAVERLRLLRAGGPRP